MYIPKCTISRWPVVVDARQDIVALLVGFFYLHRHVLCVVGKDPFDFRDDFFYLGCASGRLGQAHSDCTTWLAAA